MMESGGNTWLIVAVVVALAIALLWFFARQADGGDIPVVPPKSPPQPVEKAKLDAPPVVAPPAVPAPKAAAPAAVVAARPVPAKPKTAPKAKASPKAKAPAAKIVAAPKPKPAAKPKAAAPKAEMVAKPTAKAKPDPKATPKAKAAPKPAPKPAAPKAAAPAPLTAIGVPGASGAPDNLLWLKGVGPKLNVLLVDLGITRFDQIAAWGEAEITKVDANLGNFAGRIVRDNWVEQAGLLARGAIPEFEAKFGKLDSEN